MSYNYLNQPESIEFSNGGITNLYSASGRKLEQVDSQNGTTIKNYVGAFEYQDGLPVFMHTEEGLARYNNESEEWKYEWHLRDHIGNLRVAYRRDGASYDGRRT